MELLHISSLQPNSDTGVGSRDLTSIDGRFDIGQLGSPSSSAEISTLLRDLIELAKETQERVMGVQKNLDSELEVQICLRILLM